MATIGKVTLAVIATKLDLQTEAIKGLLDEFKQHVKDDAELALQVDRLTQNDARRTKQLWSLWGGMVALLSGIGLTFFK